MRDWVVGGALILSDEGVLLVQNRRRNGSHDWTPPGGVIDEGESLLEGLTREVQEETGLRVTEWAGPLYEVRCEAPTWAGDCGSRPTWRSPTRASSTSTTPTASSSMPASSTSTRADRMVAGGHPWVCEPLGEWLAERWGHADTRPYGFHVAGALPDEVVVTRAEP